jgi:RES domain-containing protein
VVVYRLGSSRYPANEGLGASLYGGRWNRKGTAVIYTAESRALCALEMLVNTDELADDYIAIPIELPSDIAIETVSEADPGMPLDWDADEAPSATQDLGTNWAERLTSAILSVPSSVIPRERNYILNPAHPAFARIRFGPPEPFYFDDRIGRAWRNRPEYRT